MESFGVRLNALRKNKNLSQEQFAEIMNVSRQSISKWENDSAYPEMTKLIFMSDYFEVSLDYLILGEESAEKVIAEKHDMGKVETLLMAFNSFWSNMSSNQKGFLMLLCITAVLICLAVVFGAGSLLGRFIYVISH